jgi:hypothetical protein
VRHLPPQISDQSTHHKKRGKGRRSRGGELKPNLRTTFGSVKNFHFLSFFQVESVSSGCARNLLMEDDSALKKESSTPGTNSQSPCSTSVLSLSGMVQSQEWLFCRSTSLPLGGRGFQNRIRGYVQAFSSGATNFTQFHSNHIHD